LTNVFYSIRLPEFRYSSDPLHKRYSSKCVRSRDTDSVFEIFLDRTACIRTLEFIDGYCLNGVPSFGVVLDIEIYFYAKTE
jgi:hypothetical protein